MDQEYKSRYLVISFIVTASSHHGSANSKFKIKMPVYDGGESVDFNYLQVEELGTEGGCCESVSLDEVKAEIVEGS